LCGLVLGALLGAAFGLVSHALSSGRRDFTSFGVVRADRYAIVADEEVAESAARRLGEGRWGRGSAGPWRKRDRDGAGYGSATGGQVSRTIGLRCPPGHEANRL
jgi:hypothetical protein